MGAWHRLSKISEQLAESPNGYEQWAPAHAAFHLALVAACGSNKLLQIRAQLYQQSERYRRYSGVVARDRDVPGEHRRIFDATIARDTAAAIEAIAQHFRVTVEVIIDALRKDEERREMAV